MRRFQRMRGLVLPVAALCAVLSGCSRPVAKNADIGRSSADQRPVPFQSSGELPPGNSSPSVPFQPQIANSSAKASLPFRSAGPATLPAGTLLTVRLQNPISADRDAHRVFSAVVDEPVIVDGNVLVERGAGVMGRIESTHSPAPQGNRCCIRLTLDSIGISGKELPIQTSTLFAHRNATAASEAGKRSVPEVVWLKTGYRLTFRLAQATYVSGEEPASR